MSRRARSTTIEADSVEEYLEKSKKVAEQEIMNQHKVSPLAKLKNKKNSLPKSTILDQIPEVEGNQEIDIDGSPFGSLDKANSL
mmetsp:Transcript_14504/g.12311  ORF Transcript_14504/g.12311 Transcript_14504/m.12311 type:complete len:84 (+) Transcript_14504:329-580(+)